jgi:hypothetical protein
VGGFAVLLSGTLVYNEVVQLGCCGVGKQDDDDWPEALEGGGGGGGGGAYPRGILVNGGGGAMFGEEEQGVGETDHLLGADFGH